MFDAGLTFEEKRDKFEKLHDAICEDIRNAPSGCERHGAQKFIVLCDAAIADLSGEMNWLVFRSCANLLSEFWLKVGEFVWEWILFRARTADDHERIDLKIALFELLAEDPLELCWLERLLECLKDPRLIWVIKEVYENKPEKLFEHILLVQVNRIELTKRLSNT